MLNSTEPGFSVSKNKDINKISKVVQCAILKKFGFSYKRVHGYLSLSVSCFGSIANILNLIILTRTELVTPTNIILTGLAFADMLNMLEYIPYVFYLSFYPNPVDGTLRKTYPWALFVLFHANFSQVCHTIAIWLTLTLAIWRYIMVTRPLKCKSLCSMRNAKIAVILAYTLSPFLCTPMFFSFSISEIESSKGKQANNTEYSENLMEEDIQFNQTDYLDNTIKEIHTKKYIVNLSDMARAYPTLKRFNFWFFSVIIKIIPCLILTIVSYHLIKSIRAAQRRKEEILGLNLRNPLAQQEPRGVSYIESECETGSFTRTSGEICATSRTTRMLVAVLLLFLITEFPQGILALLSDLLGEEFFQVCYMSISDLLDLIALLNSAINFILYCTMSQKFRDVFCQVFLINKVFCK